MLVLPSYKVLHLPFTTPNSGSNIFFKVDLYSKIIERPKMTVDNTPEKVQEVTLEGEKTNNRNYFCRVTIRRRPTDLQYLGELYLEEDTSNSQGAAAAVTTDTSDSSKAGKACQFFLGSKLGAQK